MAANFGLLVLVFLHRKSPLPAWAIAGGFLFTFLALIGTYATADYVASHQLVAGTHKFVTCYTATARDATVTLRPVDAVYFAVTTMTTTGFGDITPHSETCRWLTSSELAVAFPILGLSVGGVAGRMLSPKAPPR